MLNEAFEHISNKVETALEPQGFKKEKISSMDENEMVSLYTSETMAYSVVYYTDEQHMVLRECAMTDDGPNNEWKTLATWMFDPDHDTLKEASSIANDFCDALSAPSAIKNFFSTETEPVDAFFLLKRRSTGSAWSSSLSL